MLIVSKYWANNRAVLFEFISSNSPAEAFYKLSISDTVVYITAQ